MNKACFLCKGACCKSVIIYLGDGGNDLRYRDANRFVRLHGEETPLGTRFEAPCKALTSDGLCSLYADRPVVCREHYVGCPNCIECIDRYHTPEDAKRIKQAFETEAKWEENANG